MKKLLITVLFGLLCVTVRAEPTPTVRAFIDTPVSLLSFGIFKLETELNRRNNGGSSSVSYNWDTNRLTLSFFEDLDGSKCPGGSEALCRKVCTNIFKSLKRSVCLGKNCSYNRLPQYFSHDGYSQRNFSGDKTDEDAARDLLAITEIEVTLHLEAGSREFICRGAVTENEPSFKVRNL
jgi:hypothetical protein